jgi:hypothetical protein
MIWRCCADEYGEKMIITIVYAFILEFTGYKILQDYHT